MDNILDKKIINYGEAIYQATHQEMKRDKNVFVYGLGVDDPKGHYGTTKDLHLDFNSMRSFDTPLSALTIRLILPRLVESRIVSPEVI